MNVEMGLSDYISTMSQPAWVWQEGLDFPRLYSWSDSAREEIYHLFNYDQLSSVRDDLQLELPDFENLSLSSLCKSVQTNLTNYCSLAEHLTSLETTLDMMSLASHPLVISEKLKSKFK